MMDGQNLHEPIPKLPPPEDLQLKMPHLSDGAMRRLRRAYLIWCTVTVSAALLTLGLLAARGIGRLREDTQYDYKFVCLSHNTLRGAAGGAVLLAELLAAEGYLD